MENAELIGLSRQIVLRRQLDVIANNLANLNTSGFKKDRMIFEEYIDPVAKLSDFSRSDQRAIFVQDRATASDFSQGSFVPTGNPLDVAIGGEGYFVIERDGVERFTRAGSFVINDLGELTTSNGDRVLGDGGPITFTPQDTAITIADDGTISTTDGIRGKLRVVSFEDESILKKETSTVFRGDNPQPVEIPRVVQGSIEQSNVQAVAEITNMINVTRR